MNKFVSHTLLLAVILLAVGCANQAIPKKDMDGDDVDLSYSDDLSKYRPTIEAKSISVDTMQMEKNQAIRSSYEISNKMNTLMDSITTRNNKLATLSGYTIMVYSGTNQVEAGRVRNRLFDILPAMEAQIQYKLPTYFVKIGEFYQQIEAQPLYEKIRKYYPAATVVPEQFKLEK
ncbi:hypothetical protein [Roseivirga echinicomitans]|uniref:SPOR domain-containing protein n=1 Tax=Roseivirga echinicomitans TaxID=296218 RepID=A0A150X0T7_9BACT|nr:hypothetical protein [Roseivirga echinicomitans]KYG72347.1 hypothetical protein AWN68_11295 [Roseivirga echinicomitans]